MDLTSRLRSIVRGGAPARELTCEPDTGGYEAVMDIVKVGAVLGGTPVQTTFGQCLVIDRRYEADRFHGDIRIGDCDVTNAEGLSILDPGLPSPESRVPSPGTRRTIFIDLETTGLSGGAGTVAFLVGCGYFDMGAFQVRQFLLTSYASERALLAAVADFFEGADLIVTYNGKTFDVPVMETRWSFHRLAMPLDGVPHFDMLHPARRLWRNREGASRDSGLGTRGSGLDSQQPGGEGCRLSALERVLFGVRRVGDVPGFEIPGRFFQFLRNGDPRPLEPVLEHNRIDLVSLAAVTAHAARLASEGPVACRDCAEALALGRIYERADDFGRAEACYRRALQSDSVDVLGETLYRLGLRLRRERRFGEAALIWRQALALTESRSVRRHLHLAALRRFAAEALAIHHEHRERNLESARELALFALEDSDPRQADDVRHRLARLERKMGQAGEQQTLDPHL